MNVEKVTLKKDKEKKELNFDIKEIKKHFNSQVFGVIAAVSFAIILLLYVWVFLDYQERTEQLEASNLTRENHVRELEQHFYNMDEYQSQIVEMNKQLDEILAAYPADVKEEDAIMLAVKAQTENDFEIDSILMSESEDVYDIALECVTGAGIEQYTEAMKFRRKTSTYVNSTSYGEMKDVLRSIVESGTRLGIENISYLKNSEEQKIDGSIEISMYSVVGTGKEYEYPNISEYISGTSDFFGTGSVSKRDSVDEDNR